MKLTAQIKLLPTENQFKSLKQIIQIANSACNYISDIAWKSKIFNKYKIHKLCYYDVRDKYNLSAQVTVRCIAKVSDAYKLNIKNKRHFKEFGGIAYDSRILSYNIENQIISIWTCNGRLKIPFVCGDRQKELLKTQQGESYLCFIKNIFFLNVICNIDEPDEQDINHFIGVDLGINNIVATSDGDILSGSHLKSVRHRNQRLRTKLQKKGTASAKRLLKKRSGREKRFTNIINHTISKQLVNIAHHTNRGISLENLKGIRSRIRARRKERYQLHSWNFYDLQQKILYKAKLIGIPVIFVDPKNTSRECSKCGHISKSNRKIQSKFLCVKCGFSLHADINAARNISCRAAINQPNVAISFLD